MHPDAAASSSTGDSSAATAGLSASGMVNAELLCLMQGALGSQSGTVEGARTTTLGDGNGASIPTANAGQVDAIENILHPVTHQV